MLKITFLKETNTLSSMWAILNNMASVVKPETHIHTLEGLKHRTLSKSAKSFINALSEALIPLTEKYYKTFDELDIISFNKNLHNIKTTADIRFQNKLMYFSTPGARSGKSDFGAHLYAQKISIQLDRVVLDKDLVFYHRLPEKYPINFNSVPDFHSLYMSARTQASDSQIITLDSLLG
jgi:hypothetical protein